MDDVTEQQVLDAMRCAVAPVRSGDLAIHLGLASPTTWKSCPGCLWHGPKAYDQLHELLASLRRQCKVVKLPHEDARSSARYALCRDFHAARQMQRLAVELKLARAKTPAQRRKWGQILTGLQSEAA